MIGDAHIVWVLYAYDDQDNATVLETFDSCDGKCPSTERLRGDWPRGAALYEYWITSDDEVAKEKLLGIL